MCVLIKDPSGWVETSRTGKLVIKNETIILLYLGMKIQETFQSSLSDPGSCSLPEEDLKG